MVKLKKTQVKHLICNTCKGNGYVKLKIYTGDTKVFQCWDCDSEGEFYETVEKNNTIGDNDTDVTTKLH
jgi:hypothetical protein